MLVTLKDIKASENITDNNSDFLLSSIMKSVDSEVKDVLGREIEQTQYTEYYDGDGTSSLILDNYPIVTVTSIYDDIDHQYGASSLISSDSYLIYNDKGKVELKDTYFSVGSKNIKIIYTAGYTNIPEDLKQALIKLCKAEFLEANGQINVLVGENSYFNKPKYMKEQAWKVINKYRRFYA